GVLSMNLRAPGTSGERRSVADLSGAGPSIRAFLDDARPDPADAGGPQDAGGDQAGGAVSTPAAGSSTAICLRLANSTSATRPTSTANHNVHSRVMNVAAVATGAVMP